MSFKVSMEVELEIPLMVSFLRIKGQEGKSFPVSNLSDKQVEDFIVLWGREFKKHVETRRRIKDLDK